MDTLKTIPAEIASSTSPTNLISFDSPKVALTSNKILRPVKNSAVSSNPQSLAIIASSSLNKSISPGAPCAASTPFATDNAQSINNIFVFNDDPFEMVAQQSVNMDDPFEMVAAEAASGGILKECKDTEAKCVKESFNKSDLMSSLLGKFENASKQNESTNEKVNSQSESGGSSMNSILNKSFIAYSTGSGSGTSNDSGKNAQIFEKQSLTMESKIHLNYEDKDSASPQINVDGDRLPWQEDFKHKIIKPQSTELFADVEPPWESETSSDEEEEDLTTLVRRISMECDKISLMSVMLPEDKLSTDIVKHLQLNSPVQIASETQSISYQIKDRSPTVIKDPADYKQDLLEKNEKGKNFNGDTKIVFPVAPKSFKIVDTSVLQRPKVKPLGMCNSPAMPRLQMKSIPRLLKPKSYSINKENM